MVASRHRYCVPLARSHGRVWSDRYHSHVLRARREVATVLRYVLGNFARHTGQHAVRFADPYSSVRFIGFGTDDAPVARRRTWLLSVGWRI